VAFDEQLAARVRRYFSARRLPLEEKRMMGGLCFMVRGKMCVGVEADRLLARIGPDREAEALARTGCTPMDFTGRPMRGFVFVSRDGFMRDDDLEYWLGLALAFNPEAKASKSARKTRTARAVPTREKPAKRARR
jgi:hypothetical protein